MRFARIVSSLHPQSRVFLKPLPCLRPVGGLVAVQPQGQRPADHSGCPLRSGKAEIALASQHKVEVLAANS